jgi:hypothetical protein
LSKKFGHTEKTYTNFEQIASIWNIKPNLMVKPKKKKDKKNKDKNEKLHKSLDDREDDGRIDNFGNIESVEEDERSFMSVASYRESIFVE